jgi:hypothetical protein
MRRRLSTATSMSDILVPASSSRLMPKDQLGASWKSLINSIEYFRKLMDSLIHKRDDRDPDKGPDHGIPLLPLPRG